MCRGRIQWWQSRTILAAPVAGWTSSAGEGSTASAGPFMWLSHFRSWKMVVPRNLNGSTPVTVLLRLHQTASSLTSSLQADLSPSWMRPISVVLSENFSSLTEWSFDVISSCTGRRAVGREHSLEELQCWSYTVDPLTDGGGHGYLS